MAKGSSKVTEFKVDRNALLAKITRSTQYVSKLRQFAERRAAAMQATAEEHYQGAIAEIGELLEDGVGGAATPLSRLFVDSPANGRVAVAVQWSPLHSNWLKEKRNRSIATFRSKGRHPRGKSFGPNQFWLDERKFVSAYRNRILGKGAASVDLRMREMRGGDFELRFELRLDKLPARYLDRAIRRSLMRGAGGSGRNFGLIDIPESELTSASKPRGLARGGWPEQMRPLMRPIAQRLGRAMKQQILKTLNRR